MLAYKLKRWPFEPESIPCSVAAGSGLTRGERKGPHIIKATGGTPLYPVNSTFSLCITSSSSRCTLERNTWKIEDKVKV